MRDVLYGEIEENMRKKIAYLDGFKGIGCIMVMLGHYYCIYSLAESFLPVPKLLAVVFKLFGFFLDADLGLFFFALISGYCIAMTKIQNGKEFLWAVSKRFLRFWLPILGANLIIYIIYLLLGFHNAQTVSLFQNSWLQGYYGDEYWLGLAVRDSVKTVIGNGAFFNASFWVISDFFYASIIVYTGSYLEGKCDSRARVLFYLLEFALAMRYQSMNGAAIVLGSVWYKEQENPLLGKIGNQLLYGAAAFSFLLLSGAAEFFAAKTGLAWISGAWAKLLYAAVILYTIGRCAKLQRIFENQYLQQLSSLSFGIYALHWPVICSLSCWLFLQVEFSIRTYLMIGLGTVLFVFLLAWIYCNTVERFCNWILKLLSERKNKKKKSGVAT